MRNVLKSRFAGLASTLRTRTPLQVEILALRHQLVVLQPTNQKRLRLRTSDRFLWIVLSRFWPQWRECLMFVKPLEIRQPQEFAIWKITPGASPSTGRLPAFSQCRRISHHFWWFARSEPDPNGQGPPDEFFGRHTRLAAGGLLGAGIYWSARGV